MLGTAIPLPIKSAAAERVARPHDDDIALLRQGDPPQFGIPRLMVAYRKVGRTIDELPLPFSGIEADCGDPKSRRSGSRRGHCREYPGSECIVTTENPQGVLPLLGIRVGSVGEKSAGSLAYRGGNRSQGQSSRCQAHGSPGSN